MTTTQTTQATGEAGIHPDVPIFDADQHIYETPDALTKFLPDEFKPKIQFVNIGRHTRVAVMGRINDYMPNPTFERVAAPGAHEKFYAGQNPEGLTLRQMSGRGIDTPPGARDPQERLRVLDQQGVDECLNFPTLANLVEHSTAEDPDLTAAVIHALNEWLYETWSFNVENRIFTTPVLTLGLVDNARRELEWILDKGAKVALIKPAPVKGYKGWRSPALPEFDPFWRDVEDAGLPIVLHASQPPLQEYIDKWEPPTTHNAFEMSAFKWTVLGHREIADMITSLVCHGTLTRFPKLRIASVENGSSWIKPLFDDLQLTYGKMPQNFEEHPHDVFRRNIWVSPFWEGKVEDVVNTVGWDRVLFGSDWPHPEGLAEPKRYWHYSEGMTRRRAYDFMGDNARRFMGLPLKNPDPDAVKPPVLESVG